MLLKLKGDIVLLLVEYDESKWRKCLVRDSGKWVVHTTYDKGVYGTMNVAILEHNKLAKAFKSWERTMNP